MTTTTRRAGVLSIVSLAALAVAAPASAQTTPSDAGSSYLARQLVAGGHQLTTSYQGKTFPATGLSADAILAIASTKTAAAEAETSATVFAGQVKSYVSYDADRYAGATAKSLITLLAAHRDPKASSGVDLVSELKTLENANGRFADKSAYGDNSSTLTQALAIIALVKAGQPVDAKAVTNLLSAQCTNGGFAFNPGGTCSPDNDVTAFAIQALAAVKTQPAALAKAGQQLASVQAADGGVGGGIGAPGANTNSTGLAAVAYALSGHPGNAAKAKAYVASLQYDCSFAPALRGGISYSKTTFAAAKKAGDKAVPGDTDTRATAQALLAFTQQPYVSVTVGGSAATPSLSCATSTSPATPTTKPTGPTTKPTSPSKPTAKPTVPTTTSPSKPSSTQDPTTKPTGPVVNTDLESNHDGGLLPVGAAALALAGIGGGLAFARRR